MKCQTSEKLTLKKNKTFWSILPRYNLHTSNYNAEGSKAKVPPPSQKSVIQKDILDAVNAKNVCTLLPIFLGNIQLPKR